MSNKECAKSTPQRTLAVWMFVGHNSPTGLTFRGTSKAVNKDGLPWQRTLGDFTVRIPSLWKVTTIPLLVVTSDKGNLFSPIVDGREDLGRKAIGGNPLVALLIFAFLRQGPAPLRRRH